MDHHLVLTIHSVCGVLVFLLALVQFIFRKGGARHRILGNIYLVLWLLLLVSGAHMGGLLITLVGIFGFYFALTGGRIGHNKQRPLAWFDKVVFVAGGLVSLAMLYYAVVLYGRGSTSFAIIFLVFGLIFLQSAVKDIAKYVFQKPLEKQKLGKMDWFFEHFIRMSISFIAAVTAFASIQNIFGENTLNFLLPTVIGTVLIALTKRYYVRKMGLAG